MSTCSFSKTKGRSATRRSLAGAGARASRRSIFEGADPITRGIPRGPGSSCLGKNLLWVAKQHGHSVEVMLRMYAAWLEGATDSDIHAIKKSMDKRPDARAAFLDSRTAISAVNTVSNRVTQIVIRPLKSREFGSSLAAGKDLSDSSLRNASKIKWRRGWDCSRPGTAARPPLRSGPPRPGRGVQKSLRDFCRTHVDANRNQ
jgi:hypothetical protein